jgi:hypothetical protein
MRRPRRVFGASTGALTGRTPAGDNPTTTRIWRRMTWYVERAAWRIERVTNRWQLSHYVPATETWQRVGSYPSRADAIQAAYEPSEGAS